MLAASGAADHAPGGGRLVGIAGLHAENRADGAAFLDRLDTARCLNRGQRVRAQTDGARRRGSAASGKQARAANGAMQATSPATSTKPEGR